MLTPIQNLKIKKGFETNVCDCDPLLGLWSVLFTSSAKSKPNKSPCIPEPSPLGISLPPSLALFLSLSLRTSLSVPPSPSFSLSLSLFDSSPFDALEWHSMDLYRAELIVSLYVLWYSFSEPYLTYLIIFILTQ